MDRSCPHTRSLTRCDSVRPRNWAVGLMLMAAVTTTTSRAPAQDAGNAAPKAAKATVAREQAPNDRTLARTVAQLLPMQHVSGRKVDDQVSERALKLYLEMLDPLKVYFLQSDIDSFQKYKNYIDDMVRAGDIQLAYAIFNQFTKRVDQRVAVALELLDQDFDFNVDETITVEPDAHQYANNADESRDRWRRQIKYAMLVLMDDEKTDEEARDQLRRRYKRYAKRWRDTDSDDLLEMYLTSITNAYDPHSTYMSPGTLEDFQITMSLNLDGIGAALREKDGNTVVSSIIAGGAAYKDGQLKPDDIIVSVSQGESGGEAVDIVEMPLKDVVDLIRGKAGTTVRLGVKKGGVGATEEIKIVRARVQLEESAARGEIIEHTLPGSGQTMKIGYINLPSFYLDMEKARQGVPDYRSSTRDVRRIVDDFRSKNVSGIVLDLSKNGGGSLTEAITLTGLFIDTGPVVQVKDADGKVTAYSDDERGLAWNGPLVVLTSKFSASASEILAGAIRDYGRGIVVGDPATHGKGTVQTLMDIAEALFNNNRENMGALKVTLQQFYLPDGESTQLKGVPADLVLPSLVAQMDVGEDDLEFALDHDRVPKKSHSVYGLVPQGLIDQMRNNSASRIAKDEEFVELLRKIEVFVRQKEEDVLSLNKDKFAQRRKELDSTKEEDEKAEELDVTTEKIYPDTFYYTEVMNVAADYIQGLRAQKLAAVN